MTVFLRRAMLIALTSLLVPFCSAHAQGTIVATDNFDRADESPVTIGGNWARTIAGNYDGFSVLSGSAIHSASNEGIYYWQGAGTFDPTRQFARERVVQKDGEQGLVLLGGANQSIMVSWGPPGVGSTVYIYWYSGGVDRGQLATGPSTLNNGDIIEASLESGQILAKVNGVTVLSVANTTTLSTGNPGFITYLDLGQPGLVSIVDNWEAGTPVSGGGGGPSGAIGSDDFNRADETPLAVGGDWQRALASGSVNLSGQQVAGSSGDALYYWTGAGTFDNARQFARSHVVNPGGQVGLVLLGAANQGFVVSWSGGTVFFYWYTGGAIQPALLTAPSTLQAGDVIEAMLDGGRIYAKRNGAVVASVLNSSSLTAGTPGFETFQGGASFDDWEAGTPANYTIIGTITESAVGLAGVQVGASGDYIGSALTNGSGAYTISGVPINATSIVLTPSLSGHTMSPLTRTVAGPVTADVIGQDFTSTQDGGGGGGPGVIASDDFNRADETPLTVGGNWVHPFNNGSVNLTGNHIASASGEALYNWQGAGSFSNTRQYARVHVLSAGGQVGLVLLGGPNQALVTSWGSGRLFIYWYLNGSHQGELVNIATPLNDGDVIEGVLDNGVIKAKRNGIVVASVANTTSLTSGRPGFETFQTGAVFDDWEAGTPATNTISGTITESAVGLAGVQVDASGGYVGSALTNSSGVYTIGGVPPNATGIVLTPSLGGHTMSPLTRTVAGPVTADVTGEDFTSTPDGSGGPGVIAADSFNRPNETPLTVGGHWQHPFTGGSANLVGNQVSGDAAEALYFWQGPGTFDNARQFSRLRVTNAGGQVGLVLLGGPNQALVVAWHSGTLFFYRYTGGSYQGNLTTVSSTLQNGDVIEADLVGGVIYARINGVLVASVANASGITTGRPGFETFQAGASFDDWEGGVPADGDAIAAVAAPGSAITTITPCLTVPVVYSRLNATPLMGYSVTVELSPNLTLCGAQFTTAGYTLAPRLLEVAPLGGNRWSVDEVTLGTPCGATGSGTLFTLQIASADLNGVGTVTLGPVTARDCNNQPIPAFAGAVASITIDQQGPAATTDLRAIQARTGTYVAPPDPSHSTTPIQLEFTSPGDAVAVEVYRHSFGGHPLYDDDGGSEPALPTTLPSTGWTLVTATASGQSDEPLSRDFWYYALVSRDAHGNPSAVSNMTPGTLNYYLGDVSNGVTACTGDDRVTLADLSLLGFNYGITLPPASAVDCLDVGPTSDHSPDGRPLTDQLLQFEDLVIMALNFGAVSNPIVASRSEPALSGDADRLAVLAPQHVVAGQIFEARVELHAGGRLHALSVGLGWDAVVVEPQALRSGGFLEASSGMTLKAGPAAMDGAVLGRRQAALSGDGTYAIVKFRATRDGDPAVHVRQALGRDRDNQSVTFDELASTPGPVAVSETRLLGASPAPFTSQTAIQYSLAVESDVELAVFGIDGRRVRTLERGHQSVGVHRVRWDGTDDRGASLAAGMYYTRLTVGSKRFTKAVVRLAR